MEYLNLDNFSSGTIYPEVIELMTEVLKDSGNPDTSHTIGRKAQEYVLNAREKIAESFGAETKDVIFTSGITEANNIAIQGLAKSFAKKGKKRIVTSNIEHVSVRSTLGQLEKEEYEVVWVEVEKNGLVDLNKLKDKVTEETAFVTIQAVNDEIGTIQDIKGIGEICKEKEVAFHSDWSYAAGKVAFNMKEINIDVITLDSHALNGPLGVGAMIRKRTKNCPKPTPILYGGAQEYKIRPGKLNVAGIAGFGKAVEIALERMEEDNKRIEEIQKKLKEGILEKIGHTWLNGDEKQRVPHNLNIGIKFVEGESILLHLDLLGIAVSTGSSCYAGDLNVSPILTACGLADHDAQGSLRLTLGWDSTEEALVILDLLPKIISRLREMSAFSEETVFES